MTKVVDWERIELDYRAGIKTLRDIAQEHGITHGAITKRSKRDDWVRDLTAKIQAKVVINNNAVDPFDKSGFVYVIYLDDSSDKRYYKIGMASHFNSRFSSHNCSSPFDICVACVYYVANMRKEERLLHDMFDKNRIKGEWFDLSDDDLVTIALRSKLI